LLFGMEVIPMCSRVGGNQPNPEMQNSLTTFVCLFVCLKRQGLIMSISLAPNSRAQVIRLSQPPD
jgi:hypothetical protein